MSNIVIYKIRRNFAWVRALIFVGIILFLKINDLCRSTLLSALFSFLFYLLTGGYTYANVIARSLHRDAIALKRYITLQIFIKQLPIFNHTVPGLFQKVVKRHPNKACFLFENQKWTFQQVEDFSNQVARYFASKGYQQGDVVGLFMDSRPEYVCIWLGLSKIGCKTALINYNLRSESLKHCIDVAKCRSVVFGVDNMPAIKDSMHMFMSSDIKFMLFGLSIEDLKADLEIIPVEEAIKSMPVSHPVIKSELKFNDNFLYIYTSGTTGMPKSANISHMRFVFLPAAVGYMLKLKPDDILYDPLPLYHTAGGMIGIGQALIFGRTVAIRKKFSASKFWEDCIKYNATAAQYIGEICRYLLNQPIRPIDRAHKVHTMFGNGLRPQIWRQFIERFNIDHIGEFYGATEGNANIINIDNKEGAVGFITRLLPAIYPVTLIRINEETGEPMLDEFGMCVTCEPGETGEFVGKITKSATRRFDGYGSQKETEKKIVRNVFKKGDMCFRSGDLLVADDLGYLYFKDRLGDTFRWRGENVSTTEVEGIISRISGDKDCVVYGVEVPGTEGRAGMAAIVDVENTLDVPSLSSQIYNSLPAYACPLFVRIIDKVDTTGTFKLKKVELKREGFTLNGTNKRIYFLKGKTYVNMTQDIYDEICSGKMRI